MSEAKSKASRSSSCKKKLPPSKQKPSQVSKSAVVKGGSQSGKKASAEAGKKKKSTSCKSSKKMEKKSKVEEEGEGEGEGEKEKQMSKEGGGGGDKEEEKAAANSSKGQSKKAATPPINSQYEVPVLSKVSAPPVQPQLHDPKAVMTTALSEEERAKKIEKNRQAVESIISMLQSIPPDNISPETRDDLIVIHGIAKGILARYVPLETSEKSSAEEGAGGKGSSKTEDKEEEDFKLEEVKSGKDAAE